MATAQNETNVLGKVHQLSRQLEIWVDDESRLNEYLKLFNIGLPMRAALLTVESIDDEPESIFSYDWQNLIVLDGCRYDTYTDVVGEADSRISMGSMSKDFVRKNFSSGDYSDIVYITANPYFYEEKFEKLTGRKPQDVFHDVIHTYIEGWDEQNNTVMPEAVLEDVKDAHEQYPDKRKIIHFMQPHHPFIDFELADKGFGDITKDAVFVNEWDLAMRGELSHETVKEAYRSNLEAVMPYARDVADHLPGRTMLTADHGNLLGENGLYWHPPRSKAKPLREVPMTEL